MIIGGASGNNEDIMPSSTTPLSKPYLTVPLQETAEVVEPEVEKKKIVKKE